MKSRRAATDWATTHHSLLKKSAVRRRSKRDPECRRKLTEWSQRGNQRRSWRF